MPRLARIPTLLPRENPTLAPVSMRRAAGHRRTASTLPSFDALSTTMISCGRDGGASRSDCRQRSRSGRALNDTMTIERSVAFTAAPRADAAWQRRRAASGISQARRRRGEQSFAGRVVEQQRLNRAHARAVIVRRHVDRSVAATLARDCRLVQHGRHARRKRLERRQPQPFVVREERERAGVAYRSASCWSLAYRCHRMRSPSSSRAMADAMSSNG